MEADSHPLSEGLPTAWDAEGEWYSWAESPRNKGFHVIATVDESTYSPVQNLPGSSNDLAMGDHPSFRRQLINAIGWQINAKPCG